MKKKIRKRKKENKSNTRPTNKKPLLLHKILDISKAIAGFQLL